MPTHTTLFLHQLSPLCFVSLCFAVMLPLFPSHCLPVFLSLLFFISPTFPHFLHTFSLPHSLLNSRRTQPQSCSPWAWLLNSTKKSILLNSKTSLEKAQINTCITRHGVRYMLVKLDWRNGQGRLNTYTWVKNRTSTTVSDKRWQPPWLKKESNAEC